MKGVQILMDKNSLVNIDLQPIADVTNNLIDKLANGIGWIATPKGKKAQQIEAQNYLIEQIKNDENMPPFAKAASICNAKKLIKEYTNQNDIFNDALNFLSTKTDLDKVEDVEDDWLEFFFDKAKDIGKEEMQIIWAKLLAKEIIAPNSVSKQLLHILSVIDYEEAKSFQKLANFTVFIEEKPYALIFDILFESFYNKHGLTQEEIFRLEDIGLLQESEIGYDLTIVDEPTKLKYFDFELDIEVSNTIALGNIVLSRAGAELMSIITDKRRIEGFESIFKSVIGKKMSDFNLDIKVNR